MEVEESESEDTDMSADGSDLEDADITQKLHDIADEIDIVLSVEAVVAYLVASVA